MPTSDAKAWFERYSPTEIISSVSNLAFILPRLIWFFILFSLMWLSILAV